MVIGQGPPVEKDGEELERVQETGTKMSHGILEAKSYKRQLKEFGVLAWIISSWVVKSARK